MKQIKGLFFRSPKLTGFLVFLLAISVGFFLSLTEYQLEQLEENKQVEQTAELFVDRIQQINYTANSALNILAYLVQTDRIEENFNEVGKSIIENIDILDQIQFLDSGKIVATYPLEGNEIVIGYDILANPETNPEARLAIQSKKIVFAGPISLKQGGFGIVARLPLFKAGEFQGFTAVLIDWEKFQNQVFFGFQTDSSPYLYDLIKIDPETQKQTALLGSDFTQANGAISRILVPEGNWIIQVQLKNSDSFSNIFLVSVFRIISALVIGFLIYRFAQEPYQLAKKVDLTTQELRESNTRFELATKATSEIIWDWDLETNVTVRSENFEKILGYPNQPPYNTDIFWRSIIHPDDLGHVETNLEGKLNGKDEKWEQEFRLKKADENYLYIIDKGIILRNSKGKATRVIGSTQDITSRKLTELELENQKQRLSNVIEGTRAGIWEWNILTGETVYNETWANIIGYTLEELQPISIQTWIDFSHPEDLQQSNLLLEECFRSKDASYEAEVRMKHKDGHWVWVQDRGKVFTWTEDGQPLMMFGTHVDITEKKLREEELKTANLRLQSANEELKSFASVASHDMKEPLRMISSFLSLLKKRYQDQLDEKGLQYIQFSVDGANRLSQLIEDMMEYARIGFDESKLTPLDLNKVIQEILELKKEIIEEKNAEILIGQIPQVWGIRSPIKSVLINLISNALKYHPQDQSPKVNVYAKKIAGFIKITIEDQGIGIEKEYFEIIFKIFNRLHTREAYSGTGIGLAICKKIITQHGGNIWLESELGKGSKFHFTLRSYDN